MIRYAQVEDAEQCSSLVYESGPRLFSYLYNKQEPEIFDLLNYFFCQPDNTFSREGTIVDVEDNKIRGLIIAHPVKMLTSFVFNELKYLKKFHKGFFKGLGAMLGMLGRAGLARNYPPLNKDEMFICNLAVAKEDRGKGISTALMKKVEENARSWRFSKLSLFVETYNEHAKMVYEKFGFKEAGKAYFPNKYKKYGLEGFYKMVKEL